MVLLVTFVFLTGFAETGKRAPNFALKSAKGKVVQLSKYRGKVVVVNFWATWCEPCRNEIPDFIELYKKYKSKGVEFIGISVDQDGWEVVKPYVKESGINYPIVLQDDKVVQNYGGFDGIPTTFVIDAKGTIAFEQTGMLTKTQLESKIQSLLKKHS